MKINLKKQLRDEENKIIIKAIGDAYGNLQRAADDLSMKRTTLLATIMRRAPLRAFLKEMRKSYGRN